MTDTAARSGDPTITVYFDGACPLCSAEIGHYRSRLGAEAIRFVDVSDAAADLGPGLAPEAAKGRFHVRREGVSLTSGADGFVAVWDALPGWRRLARLARLPGVLSVMELLYRGFLPIRPLLSRLVRLLGVQSANERH